MAVGTADVALGDFEDHAIPGLVHREDHHIVCFVARITMVEVEHNDIRLAAVDAWMASQVLANSSAVFVAVPAVSGYLLSDVRVTVSQIVVSSVLRVAGAAASLACSLGSVRERKLVDRLGQSAVIATFSDEGEGHEDL